MARVTFIADYIYTPSGERRVSVKYKAGWTGTVKHECAVAAIEAGAAKAERKPRRKAPPAES